MVEFYCKEVIGGKTVYYCYLEYQNVRWYRGQTLTAEKDSTITAHFGVRNTESGGVTIALQIWDYKNNREITWRTRDLPGYQSWFDEIEFTADKDMELAYILRKQEGGQWKQVASYGNFYIKVQETVKKEPKFDVVNVWTNKGTYKPDEEIWLYGEITNKGTASGSVKVVALTDNREVDSKTLTLDPGVTKPVSFNLGTLPLGEHNLCIQAVTTYGTFLQIEKGPKKCTQIKVIEPLPPPTEEMPPEEEQPAEGMIAVTAILELSPLRRVYVAFLKKNEKLADKLLIAPGEKLTVSADIGDKLTFFTKKVPGILGTKIMGIVRPGKEEIVKMIGMQIKIKNFEKYG